jgi:hypothetical protein
LTPCSFQRRFRGLAGTLAVSRRLDTVDGNSDPAYTGGDRGIVRRYNTRAKGRRCRAPHESLQENSRKFALLAISVRYPSFPGSQTMVARAASAERQGKGCEGDAAGHVIRESVQAKQYRRKRNPWNYVRPPSCSGVDCADRKSSWKRRFPCWATTNRRLGTARIPIRSLLVGAGDDT